MGVALRAFITANYHITEAANAMIPAVVSECVLWCASLCETLISNAGYNLTSAPFIHSKTESIMCSCIYTPYISTLSAGIGPCEWLNMIKPINHMSPMYNYSLFVPCLLLLFYPQHSRCLSCSHQDQFPAHRD